MCTVCRKTKTQVKFSWSFNKLKEFSVSLLNLMAVMGGSFHTDYVTVSAGGGWGRKEGIWVRVWCCSGCTAILWHTYRPTQTHASAYITVYHLFDFSWSFSSRLPPLCFSTSCTRAHTHTCLHASHFYTYESFLLRFRVLFFDNHDNCFL